MAEISRLLQSQTARKEGRLTGRALLAQRKADAEATKNASSRILEPTAAKLPEPPKEPTPQVAEPSAPKPPNLTKLIDSFGKNKGAQLFLQQGGSQQDVNTFFNTGRTSSLASENTPVVEVGATEDTGAQTDNEKRKSIFVKQARGESLTDDELGFLFEERQRASGPDAEVDPATGLLEDRLTTLEGEREERKKEQLDTREQLLEEKRKALDLEFGGKRERTTETGERLQKGAQDVLSFKGFGRSTKAAEQQLDIQKDTQDRLDLLDQQRSLQEQLFKRQLEGEDAKALEGLNTQISDIKNNINTLEFEAAQKTAELNAENAVTGQEAISNLLETLGTTTAREVDKNASELLGFVADKFGNQIGDEKVQVNKAADEKSYGTFVDPYTGKTLFYNKNDPSEIISSPGSRTTAITQPDGSISSSQSSNITGMQSLGAGPEFTRDDGTQGNLGENCVKYARSQVGNIPLGLWSKQDKQKAIEMAGNKDMSQVRVGDAIATSEGDFGHFALVQVIDPQTGELILDEANYKTGEITQGRRIDPDDPTIFGFISSVSGPQESIVVTDNQNEGNNPGIDSQVLATQEPELSFTISEGTEFNRFLLDGTIPKRFKFPAQQEAFMRNADVYAVQTEGQPIKLEPKDEFKFTQDLKKNFEAAAKDPKKALVQIRLMRASRDELERDVAAGEDLNAVSQGILVTFQKLLDPTSVVRESEYDRSPNGQSLTDRFEGFAQKLAKGGAGVTPEVLESFVETAELYMIGYENALIDAATPIQFSAKRFSLPIEGILSPDILELVKQGKRSETDRIEDGGGATGEQSLEDLAEQQGFDIAGARQAGASDEDIRGHLTQ